MPVKVSPTSIRLTASDKRLIAVAARRQGMSAAKFITLAAVERAGAPDGAALAQLTASLKELIADEVDAAIALDRIARRKNGEGRLYTGKEAWSELGLSDR